MRAPATSTPSGTAPEPRPGSVSVIVTVLADPRIERTLESLLAQDHGPDEILVDDGGPPGPVKEIAERFAARDGRIRHLAAPGTIAESRNAALAVARGEFIAFLDADEVAPPPWLGELLRPFSDPSVGFVGGPTPGDPSTLTTVGARYYDGYLRRFYDRVARSRPQSLPMGNSAWRVRLFRELGGLDESLDRRASSEDQEFAVRALRRGWKGAYRPEAWVHHDYSGFTVRSVLRKQRTYARGGFLVWRRHGSTYEASGGRIAPYVLLPALAILGLALLVPPITRLAGAISLVAALAGLGVLALGLTVWGIRLDARYPGLRYSALEIPRRWATLLGAAQGLWKYGWSGQRGPTSPPSGGTAPRSSGKP